ncbi:MAG: hypothetical protein AAF703_19340 [Cyanobacteria bacterium P01_D01_bin.105]
MSLPIVLEIAIGLIFIYLTLSLVASEIQEILSTLFQWRAEHLKRSIEQLLAGDSRPREANSSPELAQFHPEMSPEAAQRQSYRAARVLADRLYDTPLIENLNYEARGRLASWLRAILHGIGAVYRTVTFSRNVFGNKTSGPSYIPSETFATSLIERLQLEDFQRLLVRSRFAEFVERDVQSPLHDMVHELRARLGREDLLTAEMSIFDGKLQQIVADLGKRRLTLESALEQISLQLESFQAMAAELPLSPNSQSSAVAQSFFKRIQYLQNDVGGAPLTTGEVNSSYAAASSTAAYRTEALLVRLRPSLQDLTALLDPHSATYAELVKLAQREGGAIKDALDKLQSEVLPPQLRQSLAALGSRAERQFKSKATAAGSELQQFQKEIEDWFDRGMDRASGVYRRNVKGVGILIGFAIACLINADTFYMFQQLSNNQAVRSSILQTAEQMELSQIASVEELSGSLGMDDLSERIEGELRSVGTAVEDALADYPLPIGRAASIISAQAKAQESWPIPFIPMRFVGWAITAIALSMGASFWFDVLRKITSVRSAGNKPKQSD